MIARRNGELNYKATGKTFFQGLFFLSGLAVLLCLLIHAVSPYLLKRLISSPEIYQAVVRYLDWRSFGLLFSFPFLAIRSFFVGITHTKALSWSAVTAVAINIPLNYFLIFTLELGISGAAPCFYQRSSLVSIFRGNRTFRENRVGYFQYNPKRISNIFRNCQFLCCHYRFISK